MTESNRKFANRHLRFGWWSLFVFVSLGMLLEMLHGFKIGWYLDVTNETRRFMLTLAHAHGTLLSLIQIAAGMWIGGQPELTGLWRKAASPSLIAASFLLPGGFLLGGLVIYSGDPGPGIFLVPVGGIALLFGILVTALQPARKSG